MLNIKGKIFPKSEPHSIRWGWDEIVRSPGVYKVVYPPKLVESYKDIRFVSMDGRVIYVTDDGNVSLVSTEHGWVDNKSEFEKVDATVEIVITEV